MSRPGSLSPSLPLSPSLSPSLSLSFSLSPLSSSLVLSRSPLEMQAPSNAWFASGVDTLGLPRAHNLLSLTRLSLGSYGLVTCCLSLASLSCCQGLVTCYISLASLSCRSPSRPPHGDRARRCAWSRVVSLGLALVSRRCARSPAVSRRSCWSRAVSRRSGWSRVVSRRRCARSPPEDGFNNCCLSRGDPPFSSPLSSC